MGIAQICQTISNFFNRARKPRPRLSSILVYCSSLKKPGLSTIYSTSNIVKDLNKLGIPTGPMPDGSPNLTVAAFFASTKETFRAFDKDALIQVSIPPGSINVHGVGVGVNGPVPFDGTNTNYVGGGG